MGIEPAGPVLDVEGTLTRLGGDRQLFAEMAGYLLEDAPPQLNEVRAAVAADDPKAVRTHAHALKGLVAGCGGIRATQVAQALEEAGAAADLTRAAALLEPMGKELELLMRALEAYRH